MWHRWRGKSAFVAHVDARGDDRVGNARLHHEELTPHVLFRARAVVNPSASEGFLHFSMFRRGGVQETPLHEMRAG